jgi:predicted metalloprotease
LIRVITVALALVMVLVAQPVGAGAQQSQNQSSGPSGVAGNTYTSPTYGYTVTWDASWKVTDEQSQSGEDSLTLDHGGSSVYLDAYASNETEDSCLQSTVQGVSQTAGISNFKQATSNGQPLEGSGDIGTWAVYDMVYTGSDGSTANVTMVLLCRSIEPGKAMLGVAQLVESSKYNDELNPLLTLLGSIAMPGETANTNNTAEPTPEETPPSTVTGESQMVTFLKQSTDDIDAYWARIYPTITSGQPYSPPAGYVPFDSNVNTACGSATAGAMRQGDGPFYCPVDNKVYLDVLFAEDQYSKFGLFPVAEAVAHEVGHHVQMELGITVCQQSPCLDPTQVTSQELEVMADCFAGAWSKDAETRGRLGKFDIEANIAQYAVALGDPISGAGDPGAHGRGALRVYWFLDGYYNGPLSCFRASPATAARADGGAVANTTEPAPAATEPSAQPTEEPRNPADQPTQPANGIAIGDAFSSGDFTVTVTGTDQSRTIGGTTGSAVRAQGTFLVVYVTVVADGNRAAAFDYDSYTVQDADGNSYDFDSDATNALIQTGVPGGIDTEINPGETYNLAIVFDVPTSAANFTLANQNGSATVTLDR